MKDLLSKKSVEYKKLGEIITDSYTGSEIRKEQIGTGDFPAVRYKDIYDHHVYMEKCSVSVDENLIKRKKYADYGDILMAGVSSKKGTVGKTIAYMGERCLVGNEVEVLKHNQNPKYMGYLLSTKQVIERISEVSSGGAIFNVYTKDIKRIVVPIHSPEDQSKIVKFLDKFLEFENELNQELEKRKQQYEYYKELVFNRGINELNWDIRTLKEIGKKIYRKDDTITHSYKYSGNYPAITGKTVLESYLYINECGVFVDPETIKKPKYIEKGDLLMLVDGFSKLGKVCVYLGEEKCLLGNSTILIKHCLNPKFLVNYLTTKKIKKQIEGFVRKGVVSHIYLEDIEKLKIPVPSLEDQEKVVEVLDKFHSITNDFNEGIPFLIRKNREQYNYYKELLLEK